MSFLAPIMLWGSVAASIPIALHFFFRSRYRTVPWAAMKFLLSAIEQTSRRLKFQELLLLLLRVALLLLLALALARPISSGVHGSGQGTAVDAVFLFDTSMSMGADDGESTRMKRAQETALSILDQLPPHSTVQIITCADRAELDSGDSSARDEMDERKDAAEARSDAKKSLASHSILGLLGPRMPGNLDQARIIINDLKPTSLATDLKDGILLASAAVNRAKNGNKELYIFTDMQKSGWDTHPAEVKSLMAEIGKQAFVTVVRCGRQELTNAAIVDVKPQTAVPRPGERVDFAVLVSHTSGKEPIHNLQLTLLVDGKAVQGEPALIKVLQKGETYNVTMTGKLDKPGLHTVTVLMTNDGLPGDNRFDYVVRVPDYYRTLVVDGGKYDPEDREKPSLASSYYLMHEIAPVKESDYARYHIQQTRVRSRSAMPSHLDKLDLCILVNCEMPPANPQDKSTRNVLSHGFLEQLKQFVAGGGSLLIYAGDQVRYKAIPELAGLRASGTATSEQIAQAERDGVDYNKILGDKYGLLPLPLKGKVKEFDHKDPLRVSRESFSLPAFQVFRKDKRFADFNNIEVYKAFEVEEVRKGKKDKDENVTVVLRYKNGWPAVISRKLGAGEVFFVTTSAEPGSDPSENENPDRDTRDPQYTWNNWAVTTLGTVFVKSVMAHLASGASQEHNFVAGKTFTWNARDKTDKAFTLYHPRPEEGLKKDDRPREAVRKLERLGLPVKDSSTGRQIVQANDLYFAGIYRLQAQAPAEEGKEDEADALAESVPVAVIPDKSETQNFETYGDEAFDKFLDITPAVRHVLAGTGQEKTTGVDRLNREWTLWVLWLLLILAVSEVGLAYWCGRAW